MYNKFDLWKLNANYINATVKNESFYIRINLIN